MSRRGSSVFSRLAVSVFAALLFSAPIASPLLAVATPPCCRPSRGTSGCCADGDVSADFSANCCHLSAPEEAAPSLQSTAPALAAPPATLLDQPLPFRATPLAGPARLVPPRARSGPLFLLFATLLV